MCIRSVDFESNLMSIDGAEFDKFVLGFHGLGWIDSSKTDPALIESMKAAAVEGVSKHHVAARGSGVTTTITAFCQFFERVPKLLIVSSGAARRYESTLKNTNTFVWPWRLSSRGIRAEFCIVDDPLSVHDRKSPMTVAHFTQSIEDLDIPKLIVTTPD